jgi:hypothetical protein
MSGYVCCGPNRFVNHNPKTRRKLTSSAKTLLYFLYVSGLFSHQN